MVLCMPLFLSVLPFQDGGVGWSGMLLLVEAVGLSSSDEPLLPSWLVLWVVLLLASSLPAMEVFSDPKGIMEPLSPSDLAGGFLVLSPLLL